MGTEALRRGIEVLATLRNETPGEALERRVRESKRVEERVLKIDSVEEFKRELLKAGTDLVVLEVNSDITCDSGIDEEPQVHWEVDMKAYNDELRDKCKQIKHVFQRTARECPDVKFLSLKADTEESSELCDLLQIEVLPTVQFYREGNLLWEHKGVLDWQNNLGEGVLYYGGALAGGERAEQHVEEIHNLSDFRDFMDRQEEATLSVIDISLTRATPCIHIFPAVLAMAKSFEGYVAFARLLGDESNEAGELMKQLGVVQVPTFLFYRGGNLIDTHVGSSRSDLIGHILQLQKSIGLPPPPVQRAGKARKRSSSKQKSPISS